MTTEVPVGTFHPTFLEPLRIRFFVEDEKVVDCEITFNAVHRGVERILEGIPIKKANMITERVCGICSHIHLWSSCRVTEKAVGLEVPERANYIRVLVAELERITSHLLFFGHASEVVGHEAFAYKSFAIREPVMRLLHELSGGRVHYSVPIVGGIRPRCDPDKNRIAKLLNGVDEVEKKVGGFVDRILDDPMIMSRVEGVGCLDKKTAVEFHAVGPTARASGITRDYRKELPEYRDLDFNSVVLDGCDTKARVVARGLEVFESIKVIRQVLENLPAGPSMNYDIPSYDTGFTESYTEAPRGELYHALRLDARGKVRNYRIRTPTTTNLAAIEQAVMGDHLTDAVLTIASSDPCICCSNRALVVDSGTGRENMWTYEEIRRLKR